MPRDLTSLSVVKRTSSAPFPDLQSSYDQPVKMEYRRRPIEHAVKHLTTERDTSVCVRRDHVRNTWSQLQETWDALNLFSDEERKNFEKEISQWELFHQSQVQSREPSDLRVCYLAGDNLTNDLEVLVNLGILPQNVWMVEENAATLVKVRESSLRSNLRNVRLFEGDIMVFLKNFEGQFDIIYCGARGTLPAAKQKTLKFIGYVFLYNKLTSPGALITNFSFPPLGQQQQALTQEEEAGQDDAMILDEVEFPSGAQEVKLPDFERHSFNEMTLDEVGSPLIKNFLFPSLGQEQQVLTREREAGQDSNAMILDEVEFPSEAQEVKLSDFERRSLTELSVGYLKHRFTNISHDIGKCPESDLNLKTDEENYGDYITYQVIDSAYLYIPIRRMLRATKCSSSSPLWDQLFGKEEEFLEAVSQGLKAATATDLNCQATSDEMKYFFETIKESYLRHIALTFQGKSPSNNLWKAWITELFPDLDMIKNQDIASLLMTHLLSYSYLFINKFANEDLKKYYLEAVSQAWDIRGRFPQFYDAPDLHSTTSMVTGLLYGQMAYPSFPVVDKLLRLSYTAKKGQIFSDVFIFDKCRYVYEQFPTVHNSSFAIFDLHQQMVCRMVVEGLHKHLKRICKLDIFPCCNVTSIKAIVDGRVEFHSTDLPSIPERQKEKEPML